MTPERAAIWAEQSGLRMQYGAELNKLAPLGVPFIQLSIDRDTAAYLGASEAARHGRLMTAIHRLMRGFLSDFDINGYLGTYPMHVLSSRQWETLLEAAGHGDLASFRHLDVGAGRGDATAHLASLFGSTIVTETSRPMQKRLRRLGFECMEGDIAMRNDLVAEYDVVSLLNVLDRCDRPLTLLATARTLVKTGGLLVVALVLPYGPFVYDSGSPRAPRERLAISAPLWEDAAVQFVQQSLLPLGFRPIAISRAPYLSGGDAHRRLYELDDVIVVCEAVGSVGVIG